MRNVAVVLALGPFWLAGCRADPAALPLAAGAECNVQLVRNEITREHLRDIVRVAGDSGSCSYRLVREGPARNGFVLSKPASGTARLRFEESSVLVEYTPQPGFRGQDPFTIRLVSSDANRPAAPIQTVDMAVDVYVGDR